MIKKIINIVLVIIWMIVIFSLSNQNSNDTNYTTNVICKILNINSDSEMVFLLIRKLAHITEYLILSFLICNMFSSFNVKNILLYSLLICIIYACTDEFHQLFISGRNGQVIDILIDTFGSIIGLLVYKLKNRIFNYQNT